MKLQLEDIAPVILAGGKSSRMGSNKSFVTLGGKPLLEAIADNMSNWFGSEPLLVTNTPEDYAYLRLPMTDDIYKGMGPLGGIHAALRWTSKSHIFVCGCDMPFIAKELIEYLTTLVQGYDVVMARDGSLPEPLHALYSSNCLPAVEGCLVKGERRIITFFNQVRVRYIERVEAERYSPGGLAFMNINTPEDLTVARRIWANKKFAWHAN